MSARYRLVPYAAVATVARTGDAAAGPAVLLTVAASGGPPARGAALMAALTAAAVVAGPVTGVAAGRARRPRLTYLAALAAMGAGLGVLAAGAGSWPLPPLLAVGLLAGAGQPLYSGGWTAVLADLVPPARLPRAYALDALTYDVGGMAGPALAAAALALGTAGPVIVAAAAFVAAMPFLAAVPFPAEVAVRAGARPAGQVRGDLAAGLRTVTCVPALRRITLLSTLQLAGLAGRTIGAMVLAERLTGGPAMAGVLLAVSAAASLAGSAALTRWPVVGRPEHVAVVATAVSAASLLALAAGGPLWLAATWFAVGGLTDAPLLTSVFAVRTRESPRHLRAAVFTISASAKTSAYAVAIAGCGLLAAHGDRACFLAGALLQGMGLAVAALCVRSGSR